MNLSRLLSPAEARGALRALAGLLIGLGFLMAFTRKSDSNLGEPWGNWGLFVTLLIVTVFLYGAAVVGWLRERKPEAWQSVYMVFAILLLPVMLLKLVDAAGGTPSADLNVSWVFLFTAAAAAFAASLVEARYGLLLASIALIVSWTTLWDKVLHGGISHHWGVYRGLLVLIGLLLLAGAYAVYRFDPLRRLRAEGAEAPEQVRRLHAQDLVTGAAIAGVGSGAITFLAVLARFTESNAASSSPSGPPTPSLLWDIVLLCASLLAVLWGARFAIRGPTYVGAIGLFFFLVNVGSEIGISNRAATLVGWPLILAVAGTVLFVASLLGGAGAPIAEERPTQIMGPAEAEAGAGPPTHD